MVWPTALSATLALGFALPAQSASAAIAAQTAGDQPLVGSTDRDRDRVADDLAALLAGAPRARQVPVLVRGISSVRAHRAVGDFAVHHDYSALVGFAASVKVAQIRALAREPGVSRIDVDHTVAVQQTPARPEPPEVVERLLTAPDPARSPPIPETPAGLCVLDTGVDSRHEIFDDRQIRFLDLVNRQAVAYDDQGHGTHLTGIAAFLAPAAPLFVAKVLDTFGEGRESTVLAGLDWCLSQPGVRVVLAGFGGPGGDGKSVLEQAVDAAAARGVLVVAAAGNRGDSLGSIASPGSAAGALTVGAIAGLPATDAPTLVRDSRGIFLAPFSGRGPTLAGLTKPDVVTAGMDVLGPQAGTRDGYVFKSGTSTAAARIAGALAAALDARSAQPSREIVSRIRSAAADRGSPGPDADWGAGVIGPAQVVPAVTGESAPAQSPWKGPSHTALSGAVPVGETVDLPVAVPSMPDGFGALAATLILDSPEDTGGPAGVALELYDPEGALVAESDCPVYADVGCGSGRQETVGIPEAQPGTWTLRVLALGSGTDNQTFRVEVHLGSLASPPDDVPSGP